jgi:hypothetical protein
VATLCEQSVYGSSSVMDLITSEAFLRTDGASDNRMRGLSIEARFANLYLRCNQP